MARFLSPRLKEFLDNEIPEKVTDPIELFLKSAESCVGIMEEGGDNHGKMVEAFQATIGGACGESWCFPGGTEVLTEAGWFPFDSLNQSLKVAQIDSFGIIDFVKPISYIIKHYNGDGYRIKSNNVDLVCDSGHRFWGKFNNKLCNEFKTLSEVTTSLSIPSAKTNSNDYKISDYDLRLLAAFIADGFFSRTRKSETGQSKQRIRIQVSKERKIELLKTLNPVGFHLASKIYGKSKKPLTTISFIVPDVFNNIFDNYKKLKWSFVNSLSKRQCIEFLKWYTHFDGHVVGGSNIIFSSRKELSDQILMIAFLAGYIPTFNHSISKISNKKCWAVRWCVNKKTRTIKKKHISKIKINEKLYCVSMPNERIIVRGSSDGTPIIVGNCLSFIQALTSYAEDRLGISCDLYLTEHCLTLWDKTPKDSKFKEPIPGDLVLWRYGETTKGHVGIVLKNDFKVIETCEGNTGPSGIVERNGDGVYKKIRAKIGTSNMHLLGYIRMKFISSPIKS